MLPRHLYLLDFSRGVAALAVVLSHWKHFAYSGYGLSDNFLVESQPLYNYLKLFYESGGLAVQYFFLLSGFIFFWLYRDLIAEKKISGWRFTIQRFSRLYPLHLLTLIIVVVLQYVYFSFESNFFVYPKNDLYHFYLNLLFVSKWGFEEGWSFNAPTWSVSIEVMTYILFFIITLFCRSSLIISLIISSLALILSIKSNYYVFSGISMFFWGGATYFAAIYIRNIDAGRLNKVIYFTTVTAWIYVVFDVYLLELSDYLINGKWGVYIFVLIKYILFPVTLLSMILYESSSSVSFKSISWLGDISYSSYLLHFPLQLIFVLLSSFYILPSNFYLKAEFLFAFFVILVPLSYLTFSYYEKPIQASIRRIYNRKLEQQ